MLSYAMSYQGSEEVTILPDVTQGQVDLNPGLCTQPLDAFKHLVGGVCIVFLVQSENSAVSFCGLY